MSLTAVRSFLSSFDSLFTPPAVGSAPPSGPSAPAGCSPFPVFWHRPPPAYPDPGPPAAFARPGRQSPTQA